MIDENEIEIIILKSKNDLEIALIPLGATLCSCKYKGKELTLNYPIPELIKRRTNSKEENIERDPYYGCIVGRFANRICNGKFNLNNKSYNLAINNGPNALHGGLKGFDSKIWEVINIDINSDDGNNSVLFKYTSVDGEEGYPGTLDVYVRYTITENNGLYIDYEAKLTDDTKVSTIINLTNHTYWNLSGFPSSSSSSSVSSTILEQETEAIHEGHTLYMNCSRYLPVTENSIPIGELESVKDTPFDFYYDDNADNNNVGGNKNENNFRRSRKSMKQILNVGENSDSNRIGIDHCYVVNVMNTNNSNGTSIGSDNDDTELVDIIKEINELPIIGMLAARSGESSSSSPSPGGNTPKLNLVADVSHDKSGTRMVVYSSKPGVQLYTANWLEVPIAGATSTSNNCNSHLQHNAICLETQYYPDSINQPSLLKHNVNNSDNKNDNNIDESGRGDAHLHPGQVYRHRTYHQFTDV